MLRAYPGATSKILAANKSQPAIYGPYVKAFIHNPPTIQDQGIRHIISESIVNQDEFIGQMASVAFTWSGLDAVSTQMLNALAMAGFAQNETTAISVLYGPAEPLYVSVIPPAGSAQRGYTDVIFPGETWNAPECFCGTVYVQAATDGHCFTSVVFQVPPNFPPTPIEGAFPPPGPVTATEVLKAFLYKEYSDDDDLQAWILAYNIYTQLFIDWFDYINLPIYTELSGALLDWIAEGLYGIYRPTLFSGVPMSEGAFATVEWAQLEFSALRLIDDITDVAVTSDDVFKRIITWQFWKGDGKNLTTTWIRRRVARFLYGPSGTDYSGPAETISVLWTRTNQLTITIITEFDVCGYSGAFCSGPFSDAPFCALGGTTQPVPVSPLASAFKEAIDTGAMESPAQYDTTVRIGAIGVFDLMSLSYSASYLGA